MMITKREITLPEDGALECWAQVSPCGEFPGEQDGKEILQVCDEQAFKHLIAVFEPEVLVDFEHRSEESDDTTAAGWADQLRYTVEDGLEAHIRWTDLGAADIRNRRRRFLSGVWRCGDDGRPTKLRSIALTNKANMPNRPVLNKTATEGGDNKPGEPAIPATPQPKDKKMKELAALYGLPETASEAEILAAAQADRAALATLQARVDELERANLAAEADTVVTENKEQIEDEEEFKKLYVANKDMALRFIRCLPKRQPKAICNKDAAKLPSFAKAPASTDACKNKYQKWRDMPEGTEKDAYLDAHSDDINAGAPA